MKNFISIVSLILILFTSLASAEYWESRVELSRVTRSQKSLKGEIQEEQKKLEEKLILITDIKERVGNRGDDIAIFNMAEVFFRHEFYEDALELYKNLIAKKAQPSIYAESLYRAIYISYLKNQYDIALLYYNHLIENFPEDKFLPQSSYIAALCYFHLNKFDETINACQLIQPSSHLFSYARYLQGFCYLKKEEILKAESAFLYVLLSSENSDLLEKSRLALGQVYRTQKEYEKALSQFAKISAKSPNYDEALFASAWTYGEMEQTRQGIEFYNQLLREKPKSFLAPYAQLAIGHIYMKNGDFDLAKKTYQQFIRNQAINQEFFFAEESQLLIQLEMERELLLETEETLLRLKKEAEMQENEKLKLQTLWEVKLREQEIELIKEEISEIENNFLGMEITKERERWTEKLDLERKRLEETLLELESLPKDKKEAAQNREKIYQLQTEIAFLKNWYNFEDISREKQIEEAEFGIATASFELYREGKEELFHPLMAYKIFWKKYPKSPFAPDALYRICELTFQRENRQYNRLREIAIQEDVGIPTPKYTESIEHYETLIKIYPKSEFVDDALYGLGYCQSEQRQTEWAVATFQKLIDSFPESEFVPECHLRIGEYHFARDEIPQALSAYQKIADFSNGFSDKGFYKLGWCYYRLNYYDNAIYTFSYLVEEDYYSPKTELHNEALQDMAKIFMAYENTNEKVRNFFIQAGRETYALTVMKKIAESYEKLNDFNKAIQIYRNFLELFPDHPEAPKVDWHIALCLDSENRIEEANRARKQLIEKYQKSGAWYKINSKNFPAISLTDSLVSTSLYELASYHHTQANLLKESSKKSATQNFWLAIEEYSQFLQDYPEHTMHKQASFYYADCLLEVENYEKAIPEYENLLSWKNQEFQCDIRYNLILCYDKLGNSSDSLLKATQKFISCCPKDERIAEILYKEGELYYQKQKYENAHRVFDFLSRNYPENPLTKESAKMAAYSSYMAGNKGNALLEFEQLKEVEPEESQKMMVKIVYEEARELQESENLAEAAQTLSDFAEKHEKSTFADTLYFDAAILYEKANLWDRAIAEYNNLIYTFPKSKLATEARYHVGICYEKIGDWARAAESFRIYATILENPKDSFLGICRSASNLEKSVRDEKFLIDIWREIIDKGKVLQNPTEEIEENLAKAYFSLGEILYAEFEKIRITRPVEQNLEMKQDFMNSTIDKFANSAGYGFADWTIPALCRIGDIYSGYALALWQSERPLNELSEEQLFEYNFVLEDSAFAYVEKAQRFYRAGLEKSTKKVGNNWIIEVEKKLEKIENGTFLDTGFFEGDGNWGYSRNPEEGWKEIHFDDRNWQKSEVKGVKDSAFVINIESPQKFIWGDEDAQNLYFRYTFPLGWEPLPRQFGFWVQGEYEIYFNEKFLISGKNKDTNLAKIVDLGELQRPGKNVIAIKAISPDKKMLIRSDTNDITPQYTLLKKEK